MINKVLQENEKIVYTSKANPGKTSIQIYRFVLIGLVLTVFHYLLFMGINKMDTQNWIICFSVLFVISLFTIYGIIYNLLLKYRAKNDVYYITDKRIILINKNTVLFNDIAKLGVIGIAREKNSFGDISFHFNVDLNNALDNLVINKHEIKNISFTGIKNPREVIEIIKKANNNVFIYDDRPKFFRQSM